MCNIEYPKECRNILISMLNYNRHDPVFVQMPMANGVFVGTVMDLYVTGKALSGKQVYDLSKGESSI